MLNFYVSAPQVEEVYMAAGDAANDHFERIRKCTASR